MLDSNVLSSAVHHLTGHAPALMLQTTSLPVWFDTKFKWQLFVVLGLITVFAIVRASLSVERPSAAQQVVELVHGFVGGQCNEVIGHGYERYQGFITCIFLYVLLNNFLGLLPHVETPTSIAVVPLGIALISFVYYNMHGLRVHGPVGYLKTFAGPVWWIAWLLFPVEVISHLARVMSLTIRLYANMLASDLLTLICFSMLPIIAPTAFLGLHFLVAIIQAYVFMLLSAIYVAMAISHEH
ncbi:MAG TPA: F0F1 ATP synthase subunit A [Terracidiphilus sp.]|nr:F0F1 ATP synthase subunit A [Terracidiphilus sp.]